MDTTTATKAISGYAAVFLKPSRPLAFPQYNNGKPFREVIARGAFADTLKANGDIKLLISHNPQYILASRSAGTLNLWEDVNGLAFQADLDPNQTYANDVLIAIERGDVSGMSFRFDASKEQWSKLQGQDIRTVTKLDLAEITITGFPAYPDTEVDATAWRRSKDWDADLLNKMRIVEAINRDLNGSNLAHAQRVVSNIEPIWTVENALQVVAEIQRDIKKNEADAFRRKYES